MHASGAVDHRGAPNPSASACDVRPPTPEYRVQGLHHGRLVVPRTNARCVDCSVRVPRNAITSTPSPPHPRSPPASSRARNPRPNRPSPGSTSCSVVPATSTASSTARSSSLEEHPRLDAWNTEQPEPQLHLAMAVERDPLRRRNRLPLRRFVLDVASLRAGAPGECRFGVVHSPLQDPLSHDRCRASQLRLLVVVKLPQPLARAVHQLVAPLDRMHERQRLAVRPDRGLQAPRMSAGCDMDRGLRVTFLVRRPE